MADPGQRIVRRLSVGAMCDLDDAPAGHVPARMAEAQSLAREARFCRLHRATAPRDRSYFITWRFRIAKTRVANSGISERLTRRGKSAQYDIAEPKSWIMGSIE
jgi:hypothetical protein